MNGNTEAAVQSPTVPPPGGAQALPSEALDFAAKVRSTRMNASLLTVALSLLPFQMFDLARQGSMDLIPYLQAGLPPNLTNNRGDTLLMLAAYHGNVELTRAILTLPLDTARIQHAPADTNQLNGRGQSILAGAVFKGHDEVIKLLVENGADPLAGQPNAEDSAKMFKKWDDEGDKKGLKELFESAPGRGRGALEAPPAVPDREEQRRVPGQA